MLRQQRNVSLWQAEMAGVRRRRSRTEGGGFPKNDINTRNEYTRQRRRWKGRTDDCDEHATRTRTTVHPHFLIFLSFSCAWLCSYGFLSFVFCALPRSPSHHYHPPPTIIAPVSLMWCGWSEGEDGDWVGGQKLSALKCGHFIGISLNGEHGFHLKLC